VQAEQLFVKMTRDGKKEDEEEMLVMLVEALREDEREI